MPRKIRGDELNQKLDRLLAEMLAEGYQVAPISRTAIQKRLGLKSRATLGGKRAEQIMAARERQIQAAGPYSDSRFRRASLEEQNEQLRKKVAELQSARDLYVEQLMVIIQLMQSKGIDVEQNMAVLLPNFRR
ncbi:hypothetical protein V8G57_11500 [Collimonas sp. H4R21]|uniref:Uncharacterized protein n=1 Tax=Collimonas rhizosphaerae TaxID=3126357 RepID=A0ABU9PVN7_9BURK